MMVQCIGLTHGSPHAEVFIVIFDSHQTLFYLAIFSQFILHAFHVTQLADVAVMIIAGPALAFERWPKNTALGACKYGYAAGLRMIFPTRHAFYCHCAGVYHYTL